MEAVTVSRRREGLEFSYRIRWEKDFDALAESIREVEGLRPNKICIVSDSNVAPLYLDDVKKALEGIQGVSAEVDLESKSASVTCPEGTDPALLKAAAEKAGYTVTSIQ